LPFDDFQRFHHGIAYPYIQVKSNKYAAIETTFHWIPRAAIRGSI